MVRRWLRGWTAFRVVEVVARLAFLSVAVAALMLTAGWHVIVTTPPGRAMVQRQPTITIPVMP